MQLLYDKIFQRIRIRKTPLLTMGDISNIDSEKPINLSCINKKITNFVTSLCIILISLSTTFRSSTLAREKYNVVTSNSKAIYTVCYISNILLI